MAKPLYYNFDCNTMFRTYYPQLADGETFTIEIVRDYLDLVMDSGVDRIIMNGNAQRPWYPSKLVPWVYDGYDRGDASFFRSCYPELGKDFNQQQLDNILKWTMQLAGFIYDLSDAGYDWFAEVADHCIKRGKPAWASVRMNDAHGGNSWDTCYFNSPPQRDPASRLKGHSVDLDAPLRGNYTLCDYDHPATREYMLSLIHDAIENYNYVGLEMDWLRCPFCCNPPASDQQRETMLEFFAEVRRIADGKAAATGQPYPLSLRIPARYSLMRDIGIDVVEITKRGLVDVIAPSNYFQSTWDLDYAAMRDELADGTELWGVVETTPNWITCLNPAKEKRGYRLQSASPELMRGNISNKVTAGVDAVELYNFFAADEPASRNPDPSKRQCVYSSLAGMTDVEAQRGAPKHYTLANRYGPWDFPPFETADQLPRVIPAGVYAAFRLTACAEPEGSGCTVDVVVERGAETPRLGLSLNGSWPTFDALESAELLAPCGEFTHHLPEQQGLRFSLDASLLKDGWNELIVWNESADQAHIVSLEMLSGQ